MDVVLGDRTRRRRVVGAVLAVVVAVPATVLAAWPSGATSSFAVSRIGGTDRYDTARLIAAAAFPNGSASVLLANGLNYPDALAGAYLSGTQNIPVLLTDPNGLSAGAAQAMHDLKTKNVTILGGNLAVSDNVATQISSTASTSSQGGNLVVTRIAGATRYETAAALATSGGAVGKINGGIAALVASGANFPDALSAGPASFASHLPILLTDPKSESPQTEAALQTLNVTQVVLLGGVNAVAAKVATQLSANGARTVTRIGGIDRTDTAAQFYEQIGIKDLNFSTTNVFLANGTTFPAPDALAGASLAGKVPTAILLSEDADNLGPYTTSELTTHAGTLTQGTILGRELAISSTGQGAFAAAAGGTSGPSNGPITLTSTTVAAGGTISGTVANPSTVASLVANGCGVNNQTLTFGSTTGAFTVTIPLSQPGGSCSLTFTVSYNNGTATANPSFSITVTSTTSSFQAPSLTSVTVTRGQPPTSNDSATFTFNEPLASAIPNPSNFRLYRGSGVFAPGVGAPSLSGNSWTIVYPPGSVDNVTLGTVLPGTVTNTSGQPNFPGSVAVSGVSSSPILTVEPDLAAVTSPAEDPSNTFFTDTFSFDKQFITTPFPQMQSAFVPATNNTVTFNQPRTVAFTNAPSVTLLTPGATLSGVVSNPATVNSVTVSICNGPAQSVSMDGAGNLSFSVSSGQTPGCNGGVILTVNRTGGGANVAPFGATIGNLFCVPSPLAPPTSSGVQPKPADSSWQMETSTGVIVLPAASSTLVSSEVASTITDGVNAPVCPAASSVTVTFGGNTATLLPVAGAVQQHTVQLSSTDTVGNPLQSVFVPTPTTSTWAVLQSASESQGTSPHTNVIFSFRAQVAPPPLGLSPSNFFLIEGDGNQLPAIAVVQTPGNPSAVTATFSSSDIVASPTRTEGVSDAVGVAVKRFAVAGPPGTQFDDSSVPLSGSGQPTGQVVTPQLTQVAMTTNAFGNTVVYTFDENIGALPGSDFFLYDTGGASTQAAGNPTISGNTASFTCTFGSGCSQGFSNAVVGVARVGGVADLTNNNPANLPPASQAVTLNGSLPGTTTTTSTTV